MLTIKHVHNNGETIYSGVKQVDYTPAPNAGSVTPENSPGVRFQYDGMSVCIGGGHVYVMNESGKTIEQYRLSN